MVTPSFHLFPTETYQRLLRRVQNDTKSWACHACDSKHDVLYGDLPGYFKYPCGGEKDVSDVWSMVTGGSNYNFQPRHHQLILKYARNQHRLSYKQRIHLDALMSPYTGQYFLCHEKSLCPRLTGRKLDMIVRPRILFTPPVDPGASPVLRLVIKFTWVYVAKEGEGPTQPKDLDGFQLCPHSRCRLNHKNEYIGKPDTLDKVFTQQVQRAFAQPDIQQHTHWCPVCLADYSIEASVSSHVVIVRAWYDMLSEGASGDPQLVDVPQLDYSRMYHKERTWGGICRLYEEGSAVEVLQPREKSSPWKKLRGTIACRARALSGLGHAVREGLHGHQPTAA